MLISTSEAWLGAVLIATFVIDGDLAVLTRGPPSDPAAVTVQAAELFNIKFGVGK